VIVPAVSLGLPFSLVRYLTVCKKGGGRLILFAAGVIICCLSLFSILVLSNKNVFSLVALGNAEFSVYTFPIIIAVLGVCFALVSVRLLQGKNKIVLATTWLIFAIGIIPLITAMSTSELISFFLFLGFVQLGISFIIIAFFIRHGCKKEPISIKQFLSFGIKSAVCEFVMMILLWLPPATISRGESIVISGYFSLMLSMSLLLASPLAQIAMVLTPKISCVVEKQDFGFLRKAIYLLFISSFTVGIILAFAGPIIYEILVPLLIGDASAFGSKTYLICFASIIPLSVFYSMRNIIDVVWSPARNVLIIAFGIIVFLIANCIIQNITAYNSLNSVSISFVFTIFCIAAVSSIHGIHLLRKFSARIN
jgi:O-antigen/teichoic acid export membrane protein